MQKIITGKIKILEFIHNSGITGPGKILYGIANNINKDDFLCDVICPTNGPLPDRLRSIGVRVIDFSMDKLRNIWYLLALCKNIKNEGYHVLHIHSGQYSAFWKAMGRLLDIPVIVYTEHICGDTHDWITNKFQLLTHLILHPMFNSMVDKIVAVSDAARESIIKRQQLDPAKVHKIYNGIEFTETAVSLDERVLLRKRWDISDDSILVGMVGRISPEKGPGLFVHAAAKVLRLKPSARFIIVGDGPEKDDIEAMAHKLGIYKNIIFAGFYPDVYKIINCMDILVQPSLSESFGLSIVEAMALNKPVIVSDIGGFREIIEDNFNGLIFHIGDPVELTNKILLLINDAILRERLGRAGRKTVEERFDVKTMTNAHAALYKDCLTGKGYIIQKAYLHELILRFVEDFSKEKHLSRQQNQKCYENIVQYLDFISIRKLDQIKITEYLNANDTFIIEMFLQFLERNKAKLDLIKVFNNAAFKNIIRQKKVTDRDYDERIAMQSLQFQIDNYYEPKTADAKLRIETVMSMLDPKPEDFILDIGCGVGTFAYHSACTGANVVGVDYSKKSIEMAQTLANQFKMAGRLNYECCNAVQNLPFAERTFDKIVAVDFIEHITDKEKESLLSEMSRILKDDGTIIIWTPNLLRELVGEWKTQIVQALGQHIGETRLHYGLTNRFNFEQMLNKKGFKFRRIFFDITRPYLARIPLLNEVLSLNLAWIVRKKEW